MYRQVKAAPRKSSWSVARPPVRPSGYVQVPPRPAGNAGFVQARPPSNNAGFRQVPPPHQSVMGPAEHRMDPRIAALIAAKLRGSMGGRGQSAHNWIGQEGRLLPQRPLPQLPETDWSNFGSPSVDMSNMPNLPMGPPPQLTPIHPDYEENGMMPGRPAPYAPQNIMGLPPGIDFNPVDEFIRQGLLARPNPMRRRMY